jgi:hypothetical protein
LDRTQIRERFIAVFSSPINSQTRNCDGTTVAVFFVEDGRTLFEIVLAIRAVDHTPVTLVDASARPTTEKSILRYTSNLRQRSQYTVCSRSRYFEVVVALT